MVQGNPCPICIGECREAINRIGGFVRETAAYLNLIVFSKRSNSADAGL
jgi:hypothetical protein